ncbi:MAG TPA: fibronectin type III domain-containing protein, partial [Nitrospiraceae bacterium]
HTASPAGLSAGTYSGTATISGGGITTQVIPITMAVTAATSTSHVSVSPPSLAYTTTVGGPNQARGVTVTNTGTSSLTVTWNDPIHWLVATSGDTVTMPPGGSATITHTASPAGLSAGTYSGTATISGGGITTQVIPITMAVSAAVNTTPAIGLSQTGLAFTGRVGGPNPAAQTISIANTGGGALNWSASDNAPWLTLSPASGSGNSTMTATVNTAGLTAGTFSTTITIAATGATSKSVPVTLTVAQATSTSGFTVSPPSLAYTTTVGGPNQVHGITVTNTGSSSLTVTWNDSIHWLVATSGDTVTMPPGGSATITHTASPAGLSAGTYSGSATITGGGITKQVPITLILTTSTTNPAIGLNPTSLAFIGSVGGANPAARTISIANTGGGTLSWSASDNAPWLMVSPASGSGLGTATVAVNTAGLAAGTLNATITVAATGATPKSVPVTLTVTAPSTGAATVSWNASTSSDVVGYKVYKATASGSYGAPIATLQGSVFSYQAVGLQMNTTYFFVVTSYDAAGNESLYSNEVSKSIF